MIPVKVIVFSDSHGNYVKIDGILRKEGSCDCIVHCGDGAGDLASASLPQSVPVIRVLGNVDLHRGLDLERLEVATLEGRRVMVVHGDLFGVNNDLELLSQEGLRRKADMVFFGHTHVPCYRQGSPALFNPGTVTRGCYGVVYLRPGPEQPLFLHKNLVQEEHRP